MLLQVVESAIRRHSMIEPGERVLVAVSGGADSIVLLHALHELRGELGCSLVVGHLDHGLRASSAADARFVEDTAGRLGLPVVVERCDMRAEAQARHQGIEETGRDLRREFWTRAAAAQGAARIALGHTADDQAETVLFRLARGAGWSGLRGMVPVAGPIIRPLLDVTRAEVLAFARDRGLVWREDETNGDIAYARNRIRRRVMPELAAINPDVVRAVARAAAVAGETREVEKFIVDRLWDEVCDRERAGAVRLARACLGALPDGLQSILIREAMRRVRGDLRGIGRSHVVAARRLLGGASECVEISLPRLHVVATREALEFSPTAQAPFVPWLVPLPLGHTVVATAGVVFEIALVGRDEAPEARSDDPWQEVADADAVSFPLVARSRRRGDRFVPIGMPEDVRLKSFLINARVRAEARDRIPLVCDREKIVWVAGVRLSDRVKLCDSTRRVLVMRAKEVDE